MKLNETEVTELEKYINLGPGIRDLVTRVRDAITVDMPCGRLDLQGAIWDVETLYDLVTRSIIDD